MEGGAATLYSICPDTDSLLALEPEEVAEVVLEHLYSPEGTTASGQLNRHGYTLDHTVQEFPQAKRKPPLKALMEA